MSITIREKMGGGDEDVFALLRAVLLKSQMALHPAKLFLRNCHLPNVVDSIDFSQFETRLSR